jgi:hypothetical protein
MRHVVTLAFTSMLALAACGGGGGDHASELLAQEDPVTTTHEAANTVLTTTTAPTTTAPPTTTAQPPTTTVPPTTTTVPPTPEQAATDVVVRFEVAWTECLRDLTRCNGPGLTAEFTTGNMSDPFYQRFLSLQQAQATVGNLESQSTKIESATANETGAEVIVVGCRDDGAIVYDAIGNIVNDDFNSDRQVFTVRLIEGRWLIAGVDFLDSVVGEGNGLCTAN